ncbi:MAG: flagellar motor switch protein FliG [Rhodoferax sp.]|jgi:flagellar motor switch protein FliG|nr:flagellar motor switch protein FliG [Rhodoferax sp.]MBP9928274.1 flagellar motor switch protein FliG [Rhodoferax sp.]HQX58041.1 flagellar motor switch protein FliG [Burkholderiaceae bacterium]HQZ06888.1 flagellar motor switch protein FliG [Burkholderiaceae bacterium]HRA61416.1 flagellar motor switch protein FliG [Burkholderiaceae bacterium]
MAEEGLQDAAILLMSLGEAEAAEVFKHLSPKEVQKLGEAIARTKAISRERVDNVVAKFTDVAASQSLLVADAGDYVRNVLKRALGDDKATLLIDRILQGGDVSGIESLKWMDALSVAELLRSEHPQIVAAILVHLDFDHGSEVLKLLSERQRNEVMLRIATMEGIQPTALKDLNEVLFQVLQGTDKVRKSSLGGIKTAAEMINLMGANIEGTVIESIRSHDPDLAQKIMDKMFVFDDLLKLDNKAIQTVLKEVASDVLIAALKGAQPELRDKILSNMSSRAAETLREDLESRGPMRLSEVESQQKEILKTVRRLADEGQIVVGGGGADDAMV